VRVLTVVRQKVAEVLEKTAPGPWVVGCSTGPDSLVLADAALAARPGRVLVVYVDHGLRPEAASEGERAVAFARAQGGEGRVMRVSVERAGRGLEDAARVARHRALEEAADDLGARYILLGHTASDQAETVLARLLRGAGPLGLAGMAPGRGRFLRPFLDLPRPVILAAALEAGLEPSTDPMNADRRFLRARVRHDLLPLLRVENPRLDEALVRTAGAMREVAEVLEWAAGRVEAELGGSGPLPIAALAELPSGLTKRVLARRAAELGAALEGRHLEAALALVRSAPVGSATLHLPGLVLYREYGGLRFDTGGEPDTPTVVVTDGDPPDGPYRVRPWEPGDRMRPASLRGRSRKLQDLFTDRKIPAAARRGAVVVVRQRDGEIVWAEHVGLAFSARLQVTLTRA
jgi:tRNA(Ile)-lysidine synthase